METASVFIPRQEDWDRGWTLLHRGLDKPPLTTQTNGWQVVPLGPDPRNPERQRSFLFYHRESVRADVISADTEPDMVARRSRLATAPLAPDRIFDGTLASVSVRRRVRQPEDTARRYRGI